LQRQLPSLKGALPSLLGVLPSLLATLNLGPLCPWEVSRRSGTVTAVGNAFIGGTLSVTLSSTFAQSVTVDAGGIHVKVGTATFDGEVDANKGLNVAEGVVLQDTLSVSAETTLSGKLSANGWTVFHPSCSKGGDLGVEFKTETARTATPKVHTSATDTTFIDAVGNLIGTRDAFKYASMQPNKHVGGAVDSSRVFLPQETYLWCATPDDNAPARFENLDDHIKSTSQATKIQRALALLFALLGHDYTETFHDTLETQSSFNNMLGSIKAGGIPVYLPGDLFVSGDAEMSTASDPAARQYCTQFLDSDTYDVAGGTAMKTAASNPAWYTSVEAEPVYQAATAYGDVCTTT